VYAPIERCFLLSTNIEIVEQELKIGEGEEWRRYLPNDATAMMESRD
jgi:hypothetical protein